MRHSGFGYRDLEFRNCNSRFGIMEMEMGIHISDFDIRNGGLGNRTLVFGTQILAVGNRGSGFRNRKPEITIGDWESGIWRPEIIIPGRKSECFIRKLNCGNRNPETESGNRYSELGNGDYNSAVVSKK